MGDPISEAGNGEAIDGEAVVGDALVHIRTLGMFGPNSPAACMEMASRTLDARSHRMTRLELGRVCNPKTQIVALSVITMSKAGPSRTRVLLAGGVFPCLVQSLAAKTCLPNRRCTEADMLSMRRRPTRASCSSWCTLDARCPTFGSKCHTLICRNLPNSTPSIWDAWPR